MDSAYIAKSLRSRMCGTAEKQPRIGNESCSKTPVLTIQVYSAEYVADYARDR